jgi:hypothetical protein
VNIPEWLRDLGLDEYASAFRDNRRILASALHGFRFQKRDHRYAQIGIGDGLFLPAYKSPPCRFAQFNDFFTMRAELRAFPLFSA